MNWLLVSLAIIVAGMAAIGHRLWRGLDAAEFTVGDEGPPILIRRADHPKTYWTIAAFFTAILAGAFVLAVVLTVKISN